MWRSLLWRFDEPLAEVRLVIQVRSNMRPGGVPPPTQICSDADLRVIFVSSQLKSTCQFDRDRSGVLLWTAQAVDPDLSLVVDSDAA